MAEAIRGRRSRETTHPPPSPTSPQQQQQGSLTQTKEHSGSRSGGRSEGIRSAPSDQSESLQFRQQQQRYVPRNAHPQGHSSSRSGGRGEGRTPRGQNLNRERGQNSRAKAWREKPDVPMRTQGEQVRVVEDQVRTFSLHNGVETSMPVSSEHNVATGYSPSRGEPSENWRSGPTNWDLRNPQKGSGEDVEKLEGEREVVSNNSGGWNDLPQMSERDSCGGWGCAKEATLTSPSASNWGDAVADAERMHAQKGHCSVDAWNVSETVASGWDDVQPTTERHSPKGWDGVSYDTLNASDFDCCDSEVEILGKKVLVTVAATAGTVEKWLTDHREERKFGVDIEWRPCFQKGDYHDAAILQLSVEKHCLLVQLLFLDYFPESLKTLLADPNVMLGGVGIKVCLIFIISLNQYCYVTSSLGWNKTSCLLVRYMFVESVLLSHKCRGTFLPFVKFSLSRCTHHILWRLLVENVHCKAHFQIHVESSVKSVRLKPVLPSVKHNRPNCMHLLLSVLESL